VLEHRHPASIGISTGTGWLPGELVDRTHGTGRGIVVGQCTAPPHVLFERVRLALGGGDLRTLMSMPGAYAVILSSPIEVVLVPDAVGQFPIYYHTCSRKIVFGTRADLVAAEVNASFDLVSLALEIACPQAFRVLGTRSAFNRVQQLEPGTALRINPSGVRVSSVTSLIPGTRRTLDVAADDLRDVLRTAVSTRIPHGAAMSTDFSGGIDSTSLAFLAAHHVDSLAAVTFTQDGAPVEDDLKAAIALAELDPTLSHHIVRGSGSHLPYQRALSGADAPHPSAQHLGPLGLRLSTAVELDSTVHLGGEGGDHALSAPHGYLVDLARRGDLDTLWRHCAAWARLRHRSPTTLFARSLRLAVTTSRRGLLGLARQLSGRPPGTNSWENRAITITGQPDCHWLTPRSRKALAAQVASAAGTHNGYRDAGDEIAIAQLRSACRGQQAVRDAAAAQGVAAHAPYLDPAVVQICLSVPAWRRADPWSAKPLLRHAMTGLVPDAVFTRTTKGDYTGTAHLGVRQAIRSLLALFEEPLSADLGLIEPGPVREAVIRAAQGMPTQWAALNQVLAVEIWLRDIIIRRSEGAPYASVHRPT